MTTWIERRHDGYLLTDDPARLQLEAIHAYLTESYWAKGISREIVACSLANSLSIGAYDPDGAQVGLARFVSDFATFCYVCDVYVLETHRQRGLARAMMDCARTHPKLQGLRRWHLVTRDAHGIYARSGFRPLASPTAHMERHDPGIYQAPRAQDRA
ncbi:MAG TPA: GNAT family N-acetyltransferase [Lacunisphaera sp.]|nr:GNAT family N-acetyltransferase [Lacunisphaera sp.]